MRWLLLMLALPVFGQLEYYPATASLVPYLTCYDTPESAYGDWIFLGQISQPGTVCVHPSDPFHIFPFEFCEMVALSIECLTPIPAFSYFIIGVILMISKPEVCRIYAGRTVSVGTVVENEHTGWDRPEVQNPRSSVGQYLISAWGANPDCSVATVNCICRPQPARFSHSNLTEKPFWKVFRKTLRAQVISRNLDHSSVLCAFGLQARRAFSL